MGRDRDSDDRGYKGDNGQPNKGQGGRFREPCTISHLSGGKGSSGGSPGMTYRSGKISSQKGSMSKDRD